MKTNYTLFFRLMVVFLTYTGVTGQCAPDSLIYRFSFQGHTYEIVRIPKNYSDAASCAVERGGYLVSLNSKAELDTVYGAVQIAGIASNYKPVMDGGGASYVWIGANDKGSEGIWLWDGTNNGTGDTLWNGQGSAGTGGGMPVNNSFVNWGGAPNYNEPDNYAGNQDCGAMSLAAWPYGSASQWNDISCDNTLYFVIEKNTATGMNDPERKFMVYPNPAQNLLHIQVPQESEITITGMDGRIFDHFSGIHGQIDLNIAHLETGIYFVQLTRDKEPVQRTKFLVP